MFKEMWKELPTAFKIIWIGSFAAAVGFTGFVVWAIYKIVIHVTGG